MQVHTFILAVLFASTLSAKPKVLVDTQDLHTSREWQELFASTTKKTDAVLLWQNGKVLYEAYDFLGGKDKKHILWSTSKSISNLMVGYFAKQKRLNVKKSICHYIPKDEIPKELCEISVEEVLQYATGLDVRERYSPLTMQKSTIVSILYGDGNKDAFGLVKRYRFDLQRKSQSYRYNSSELVLLAKVLQHAIGKDFLNPFFTSMGIDDYTVESDQRGLPLLSCCIYLRPKDLLRLGIVVLNTMNGSGSEHINPELLKNSIQPIPALADQTTNNHGDLLLASGWWRLASNQKTTLPASTIVSEGHAGQFFWILPEHNAVFIRLGSDKGKRFNRSDLAAILMRALQ